MMRKDMVLFLLLAALLAIIYGGPSHRYAPVNIHEVVHLGYLNDLTHGRLIVSESRTPYGALLGLSMHTFMRWTSFDLEHFRLYWLAVNYLAALGIALLSRHLFGGWGWAILGTWLALIYTHLAAYLPNEAGLNGGFYGYCNAGRQGFALVILGLLHRESTTGITHRSCLITGMLLGLCALYAQECGPAILPAAVVYLVLRDGGDRRGTLERLLLLTAGVLVPVALFLVPYALRGQTLLFFDHLMDVPAAFARGYGNTPFPSPCTLPGEPWYYTAPKTGFYLAWPALCLSAIVRAQRLHALGSLRALDCFMVAAAVDGLISYRSVLSRSDYTHLLTITLPGLLIVVWLLRDFTHGVLGKLGRPARYAWLAACVLALSSFSKTRPLDLVRGISLKLVRRFEVEVPHAVSAVEHPRLGRLLLPARGSWGVTFELGSHDLDAAAKIRELAGEERVYIKHPIGAMLYFLSGVRAANDYSDEIANAFLASHQADIANQLRKDPPFLQVRRTDASPGARYRLVATLPGPYFIYRLGAAH